MAIATSQDSQHIERQPVDLAGRYAQVRSQTEKLCGPLEIEDYGVQSMPDASPVKWHLAHTTWFFETFVLASHLTDFRPFDPHFGYLFNSYYESVGERWPRAQRGLLTRPTVAEVYDYRAYVDRHMQKLLERGVGEALAASIELGLNHEQQHQELILTDLKHAWSLNPFDIVYRAAAPVAGLPVEPRWEEFRAGIVEIGHAGRGFAFDNELPRHEALVHEFAIANRLATNGEYLEFIDDGGYNRPELWLSDGWAARQQQGWTSPLYWQQRDGWQVRTLSGTRPLAHEPVCHVSFYEADAFARWSQARLPSEFEWEHAASQSAVAGHFVEAEHFHPAAGSAADDRGPLYQLYGDVWQWTASPYVGYPGFRPSPGAVGEYNGKFMCNQFVLRGASCATPRGHARLSYRNFFPPAARWQFTGIRLAKDLS